MDQKPRAYLVSFIVFLVSGFISGQSADHPLDNGLKSKILNEGIGITSIDSTFYLNIRVRMQNRVTYSKFDNNPRDIAAQVQRLRLKLSGFVLNPKLTYLIQTDLAPQNRIYYQNKEYLNVLMDAVIYYDFNKYFQAGFGQAKLPGNRQKLNSSSALQLTDRSINNTEFNIDYDFGVFANFKNMASDRFSWQIKTAISTGEGRNIPVELNNGLAYTGRVELYPLGAFAKNGAFFESDLVREVSPKIMIGAAYHFNHKTNRTQGVLGQFMAESKDLKALFADFIMKYRGLALMASYMDRHTFNPAYKDFPNVFVPVGYGIDYQASYIWPSNWEVIGRCSFLDIDQNKLPTFFDERQATIGISRYLKGHIIKLQFENGLNFYSQYNVATTQKYYARFQVEFGI